MFGFADFFKYLKYSQNDSPEIATRLYLRFSKIQYSYEQLLIV